jgi:hypothetical protein
MTATASVGPIADREVFTTRILDEGGRQTLARLADYLKTM